MRTIFGKMNLAFSSDVEARTREMGSLELGYKLWPEAISQIEVKITNANGDVIDVDVHDWDFELEEMLDESDVIVD